MTTFDEINTTLCLFLDDSPKEGELKYQFPLPLRIAGWNWAQQVFQNHTLREATCSVVVDEAKRSATLPNDLVSIATIYDNLNERTYARRSFAAGGHRNDYSENFAYWTWGGRLRFDRTVIEPLVLEYYATWPNITYNVNNEGKVVYVNDAVLVPEWAHKALAHLTTAAVLHPPAITAAMSNEYKIKIDSGTPLDNPREQQARAELWWYNELIALCPVQTRVYGAGNE